MLPGTIRRMTEVVRHRGPDDFGTHVEPGVEFGARRLSIIDVAGGHQPLANEDGRVIAMQNGELYNHRAIRDSLVARGHQFRTACDTEVLPHLYEDDADSFETSLRGMFAVAVWDRRRRRATLVRDRLGIKPLYYAQVGDVLIFGSELKSLVASGLLTARIDRDAIDAYLALGFIPGPLTPFEGVRKLMPGERLVADSEGVRVSRYWSMPAPEEAPGRTVESWSSELLERLEQAVAMRLMSDVPLGALLSGGLDSSLIVALMARLSTDPIETFAVGFTEAGPASELRHARLVAEHLGTHHRELELSIHDTVDLAQLTFHLDEPVADLSALGFHALCGLASVHVSVALSGQGADEMLGGYERYRNARLIERFDRLPAVLRCAAPVAGLVSPRLGRALAVLRESSPDARLMRMKRHLSPELQAALTLGRSHGSAATRAFAAASAGFDGSLVARAMYVDSQLGLVDDMLHYFDRASMAHSLEVRVPFLDHELVEFCATVPTDLKVRGGTTKYLLKTAARGLLPPEVVDRPKLGFFNPVVGRWFAAQANRSVRTFLLEGNPEIAEFVDVRQMRALVERHVASPTPATADPVLTLLMLEVWLRTYVESVRDASRAADTAVAVA